MERKIEFLGVGLSCGSPTAGTNKACDHIYNNLKEHGTYSKINCNNRKVFKRGCYSKTQVLSCAKKVYRAVCGIFAKGALPVILGGDHSLSIGTVAGSLKKHKGDVLVVWIDAHTDINTPAVSPSHYIHGMPNSISMGLTNKKLSPIKNKYALSPKNFVMLGARDIDPGEYEILKTHKITYLSVEEIRKLGIENVINKIKHQTNAKNIHISFDVDSLDPSEFTSTGYNLKNGFKVNEVNEIISQLTSHFNLSLFECVEYNPLLDKTKKDLKTITEIIKRILS